MTSSQKSSVGKVPRQGFEFFFSEISIFCSWCVWIIAGTHPGHTLELLDRKAQSFLVSITVKRLFLKHVHKVFGEMLVRT
jgi:hypothetical protein